MTAYSENIKMWMNQAEPDYYLFFIKAWIPFNAWYVNAYPSLKKSDTEIIKALQDDVDSKPKKIIKAFVEGNDYDSLRFKSYFAELHYHLQKTHITHNSNRLTFESLYLTENPFTYSPFIDDFNNVYKAEKTSSYVQAYIQQKGGKVLLDFKKPFYDLDLLKRDNDFLRLDKKIQNNILKQFVSIDPKKPISIIAKASNKTYLTFKSKNSCKIIDDTDTIARAGIKVLYSLRCMLFHGEITPTDTNKRIYKNAYRLLKFIINELK